MKGARHVYKPPKPPRSQSSTPKALPSKQSNITASSKSKQNTSSKVTKKSTVVKKPSPVSFEEMMRLASKNLTNEQEPEPKPISSQLPKLPRSLSSSTPKTLPSKQPSIVSSTKPKQGNTQTPSSSKATKQSTVVKKPSSLKEMTRHASNNLTKKQQPLPSEPKTISSQFSKPPQSLSSIPKMLPSKQSNITKSKQENTQTLSSSLKAAKKSTVIQKPPPVSFEKMMRLASNNLNKEQQPLFPEPKTILSQPPKLPRSLSSIPKRLPLKHSRITPSEDAFRRSRLPPKRSRYEDEYDDEEGDDSMDDFIVDDEEEDVRKELKNVLRNFYRSDETVWQQREKEIDLSRMNARYQEIDAEEKRSYRIARMEDMIEEKRGSKSLQ